MIQSGKSRVKLFEEELSKQFLNEIWETCMMQVCMQNPPKKEFFKPLNPLLLNY